MSSLSSFRIARPMPVSRVVRRRRASGRHDARRHTLSVWKRRSRHQCAEPTGPGGCAGGSSAPGGYAADAERRRDEGGVRRGAYQQPSHGTGTSRRMRNRIERRRKGDARQCRRHAKTGCGQACPAFAPESVTAVDVLKSFELFARAHVAGLKTLTASFEKRRVDAGPAEEGRRSGVPRELRLIMRGRQRRRSLTSSLLRRCSVSMG